MAQVQPGHGHAAAAVPGDAEAEIARLKDQVERLEIRASELAETLKQERALAAALHRSVDSTNKKTKAQTPGVDGSLPASHESHPLLTSATGGFWRDLFDSLEGQRYTQIA